MKRILLLSIIVLSCITLPSCTSTTDRYINQLEDACLNEDRDKIQELNNKIELLVAEGEISEQQLTRYSGIVMTYYDLFE